MFYEIKIKAFRTVADKKGKAVDKEVKETYLFEDELPMTAGYKALEYLGSNITITSIKEVKLAEVMDDTEPDNGCYYKVTVGFITIDEKSEKEKITKEYYYVLADDDKKAREYITELFKGSMSDFEVPAIQKTNIIEVVKFEAGTDADDDKQAE